MFDWITNAASNAGAWISDGFGNFIDWILSGLSVLFSPIIEIGEAFLDLFNAIWDFAAGLLGSLGDLFNAFFCRTATDVGVGTRTATVGELCADGDLGVGTGSGKNLTVRVDGDEFNTADVGRDHAIDCVVSAAADTDDLDVDFVFVVHVLVDHGECRPFIKAAMPIRPKKQVV